MRTLKILVVDDDPTWLDLAGKIAKSHGNHEIVSATGGFKATQVISENSFDAVITDMQMPEGSGLHLMQYINAGDGEVHVLLHSTDNMFREKRKGACELDLRKINRIFPFVEFHNKVQEEIIDYITDWLDEIAADKKE